MSGTPQRLTIGQLARMAKVSANAVRFYERGFDAGAGEE
jgi:predicted transcriptional regulator